MTDSKGRTNPPGNEKVSDSEDDDLNEYNTFSNSAPGSFRSRTLDYGYQAAFPTEPLYKLGEVVYIAIPGQAQPAGPFVITKILEGNQYKVKRQDTDAELAYSDPKSHFLMKYELSPVVHLQVIFYFRCCIRLSAYVNSDKNFVVFRRFGQVHARLLLHKQSVIAALEARLNVLDEQEENAYRLKSRARDDNIERNGVLEELEATLLGYDALLDAYLRQHERPRAQVENIKSVTRWIRGNKPLCWDESKFLSNWDDLMGPKDERTSGGLESLIRSCAFILHTWGWKRMFTRRQDLLRSSDNKIVYISSERVVFAAQLLTGIFGVIFTAIPITALYNLSTMAARLQAVGLCASSFAIFIALISHARLIEVFSATATLKILQRSSSLSQLPSELIAYSRI
ncbi:hypothetical protein IFR05_011451 [Cadophora sp. M221]|nr:hypothetical protein IFR05_011451 [Cadophora sp. M221]